MGAIATPSSKKLAFLNEHKNSAILFIVHFFPAVEECHWVSIVLKSSSKLLIEPITNHSRVTLDQLRCKSR